MKSTLGAFVIAVALVSGVGAASAMPVNDSGFDWVTVFEPGN